MWESLWSPQRGLQLLPNLWIRSCCGDWELLPHPLKEDFCLIFHWQWLESPIRSLLRSERSGQVHSVATCFSPQWPISEGNRSINNVFSDCFVTSFSFFLPYWLKYCSLHLLAQPLWGRLSHSLAARVFPTSKTRGAKLIWDHGGVDHGLQFVISLAHVLLWLRLEFSGFWGVTWQSKFCWGVHKLRSSKGKTLSKNRSPRSTGSAPAVRAAGESKKEP